MRAFNTFLVKLVSVLVVLTSLGTASCGAGSPTTGVARMATKKVLFVGDSITWGHHLSVYYGQGSENYTEFARRFANNLPSLFPGITWTVLNDGYNGSTTAAWISGINGTATANLTPQPWGGILSGSYVNVVPPQAPDLTVLMLGTNDAAPLGSGGVALSTYISNLQAFITAHVNAGLPLIIMTPPPVNNVTTEWSVGRTNAVTTQYAAAVRTLAATNSIPLVDVWNGVYPYYGTPAFATYFFSADGIHLSDIGHQAVYDLLLPVLESTLGIGTTTTTTTTPAPVLDLPADSLVSESALDATDTLLSDSAASSSTLSTSSVYGLLVANSLASSSSVDKIDAVLKAPMVSIAVSNREIRLSWPAVLRATRYNIYRTSDGSAPTLQSPRDSVSNNSAVYGGLANGTLYKYAVTAVSAFGESDLSNVAGGVPFVVMPLRIKVAGQVLLFAEEPNGPFRIQLPGVPFTPSLHRLSRVFTFGVGGSGPVRFKTQNAGVIALSSPDDITIPQDLYSTASMDLADLAGVLTSRDVITGGVLGDSELQIANTLPTDDMAGSGTLDAAAAVGALNSLNLANAGDISGPDLITTIPAEPLVSTGDINRAQLAQSGIEDSLENDSTLDAASLRIVLAGADLSGASVLSESDLSSPLPSDNLASTGGIESSDTLFTDSLTSTGLLDEESESGVIAVDDSISDGALDSGELQQVAAADSLSGDATLDAAAATGSLLTDDLAGSGTLDAEDESGSLLTDDLAGSGTLDNNTWAPVSTVAFSNFTLELPADSGSSATTLDSSALYSIMLSDALAGSGTLDAAAAVGALPSGALAGSGTLDAEVWIPTSTIVFTNIG